MPIETVKPFAYQGEYTVIHNAVFDTILPELTGDGFAVLCLLLRHPSGLNLAELKAKTAKEYVEIDIDELASHRLILLDETGHYHLDLRVEVDYDKDIFSDD